MIARGLSVETAAKKLGMRDSQVAVFITGHCKLTTEMAIRLGAAVGTTAQYWLNLQTVYNVARLTNTRGPTILKNVTCFKTA